MSERSLSPRTAYGKPKLTTEQTNQAPIFAELIDHLSDDKFAKPQVGEKAQPNIDVGAALEKALAEPTLYPPLKESVFPGDRVGIVLQSDLPHSRIVLENLLKQLFELSVEPSDVFVVVSARTAGQLGIESKIYEEAKTKLPDGEQPGTFPVQFGFHSVGFQVHDAENESGHAYLAANQAGEPVYINRMLVDADVVLPVACPTAGEVDQQNDCIYPDFSNQTIRARLEKGKGNFLARWQEIELANESLGSFFIVQVVCGPGETIQKIFAGSRTETTQIARAETNELWAFRWLGDTEMVVATVESKADDQSWDDFASALIAASRVSSLGGPLVIWSDIMAKPDRNTKKALMSQFEDGISSKLGKKMQHVAAIVNERPVFLRSRLSRNDVEELGVGFLESAEEVVRIAEPCNSALLIRDAHKCQIVSGTGESETDKSEEN